MALKRRVIVAGLGSIGQRHARLLAERKDVTVEICESNPAVLEQARQNVGALPAHTSFDAALATRPELVVICTPHAAHAPMTCAALRAGAHVLCEKPMSDSVAGARAMAQAQSETGKILRIGFTLRFSRSLLRLKQLLADGQLGTTLQARYFVGTYITLENSRSRYQRDMFAALLFDYVHGLDLLQWLFRFQPVGAYARGLQVGDLELTSNPNLLAAVLDYREPFLAELHLDYIAKPQNHFLEVLGTAGWARLDVSTDELEIGTRNEPKPIRVAQSFDRDEWFRAQFDSFLQAVAGQPADVATAAEGLATNTVLEAIVRSLKSKCREVIE